MPKIYVTASTGNPLRSTLMQAAGKERPMDAGSIQSAIASRLPQRARWHIGDTTLDFSLYNVPRDLTAVTALGPYWAPHAYCQSD